MDVDLFGDPVGKRNLSPDPKQLKTFDVFDPGSDLTAAERYIVALELERIARELPRSDYKTAARLEAESQRYAYCKETFLALQCERDYLRYFVRLFCHSRICERCSRIYTKDLKRSILPVVRSALANRKRGFILAQLTLTVTSKRFGEELPDREGIKRLYRESSEFLRRFYGKYQLVKTRSGKWRENRKRFVGAGWLASMEIGKDNNNLHCHALVFGPIRSIRALRAGWLEITGDSFGVDIRKKSPQEAVNYVLKYIAKPPQTDSYRRIAQYAHMIKGSRRLRSGGIFYNRFQLKKPDSHGLSCPVCGYQLRSLQTLQSLPGSDFLDLRLVRSSEDLSFLGALPGDRAAS